MSRHIGVFVYPGFGHILPTRQLTRELVAREHRVSYVVDRRYADPLRQLGARVVEYSSAWRFAAGGETLSAQDMAQASIDALAQTVREVLPLARSSFVDDRPDLLLYDLQSAVLARTLAKEWDRPTVQLFPYLASNEEYSFHAEAFDHDEEMLGRTLAAMREILPDPDSIWDFLVEFDQRNLVFLPRRFQPRGDTFDDRFTFVGPCLGGDEPAQWTKPGDGRAVLVSLGTTKNDQPEFFAACAQAFADRRWHVVMTLGPGGARPPAAPNIEAHEWLPHAAVLPHVDAFVCAGGMGSLLEALHHGKPVVVVPHTPENALNARQVRDLGLGAWLPRTELTAQTLRSAVEEVASDPAVRQQVVRLRQDIIDAGGAARAADVLEGYLAQDMRLARSPS